MGLRRYLELLKKGKTNLSDKELSELNVLRENVDRERASKKDFLNMLSLEMAAADNYEAEAEVYAASCEQFLRHYSSIESNEEKREFSEKFIDLCPDDFHEYEDDIWESIVCAAIEADDEELQIWAYNLFPDDPYHSNFYGDWVAHFLSEKIAALFAAISMDRVSDEYWEMLISSIWMGYTFPLTIKQRHLLDRVRTFDIDVNLTQPDALKLLNKLEEAGDREGHAHIIHSLLRTSVKKRNRITDSNLANTIVKGAINNDLVEIFQFGDTSQSAYLMPAPFKTLKTAMKEGNERAAEILQTILTKKSWHRLTQPRKRGRLAWLIRKITGQSGKFVPKPRKE